MFDDIGPILNNNSPELVKQSVNSYKALEEPHKFLHRKPKILFALLQI